MADQDTALPAAVETGVEYLYGEKQTLDGNDGSGHRLMFVVAISKY